MYIVYYAKEVPMITLMDPASVSEPEWCHGQLQDQKMITISSRISIS